MEQHWRDRVEHVWDRTSELSDAEVLAAIDALVAERPDDDAEALFEAASGRDYAGLEAEAAPLYREALEAGLDEPFRTRALIQLGSTLRNLSDYDASLEVLDGVDDGHPLAPAAAAFRALTLRDAGRPDDALAAALTALAPTLPEFGGAVARYARELS
ncbi:tetratricopeptide repeat protein [Diaminobutyricimonas aerilata]|uniref:Tetratricopeptide repeat protein n=1 Tax=Diaminobutyricimonas aerilata TaxID=1162967 RepID=A0A2M9CJ54_9MICO|nr:tetratricopeptide repeat protein [Diaminobutyricimonas aerilata]PJJ71936.1 tetratricopeptide repeat protein [Diaminobutyricimonas aerilata]